MPSFGARRSLDDAASAASAGKLDDASAHLRAYFAARYRGGLEMVKGVDADAAMLAATCAILRGDVEELGGVAQLVELGEHPTTIAARRWVDLLKAAGDGDVVKVFNEREAMSSPTLAPLLPAVLLIASERGASSLTPEWAARLRQAFERSTLASDVRARVAIVLASVALQANRRDDALRELAAVDAGAPVLPRFFAELAAERFDEAAALAAAIPNEERASAVSFAARLSVGASSSFVERALSIASPMATAAQRAAMVAAMATALAREGQATRALSVLDVEKQRSPGSPALLLATAYAALAAEDPALATSTLNRVSLDDAGAIALRLVALAAKGDADTLARELPNAEALGEEAKLAVQPAVLAALMRGGAALAEATTPPWLMRAPADADGLYAWAVMRLRQGAAKDATLAFDRSLAAKPELAQKSEAPEAARLAMARQALSLGDFENAGTWLGKVTSPSFAATKRRLEAMLALAQFASQTGARVEAHAFPILVEQMRQVARTDHDRAAHLELNEEAGRMRARESLQRGDVAGARSWLGPNSAGDAEGSFLAAVTALFEGQPLDRIERELLAATERAPDDAKLFVLLSEVRAATQGAEAKVATLEEVRPRAAGSVLLQEALVAAYGGARRGLDAKKIGFAELRRLGGNVPALVAEQIREALALEAPPKTRVAKIALARAAKASLFAKETIGQRVDLLVTRARAAASRDPKANETIAPLLDTLKRAVVSDDFEAAGVAELELIELCGRALMMIFWLVAIVALLATLALGSRVFLSLPSRSAVAAARVLPDSSKSSEAISTTEAGREQLVALIPPAQAIVAGPPPVSPNKILDGIGAGVVIDTSLAVVGVDDRRDAVHRAVLDRLEEGARREEERMTQEAQLIRDRLRSVVIVRTGDGTGSGFYAPNGIIVTNKHVIGPYLSVKVQRFDRTQIDVRVVRVARGYDLALLWDQSAVTPAPIPLADSAEIQPGDSVHAIGHPHGLDFTVTRGIVSSPARHVNGAYFVQTDAVAHPGSSGGPLLDADGRVVGVSTFGMREDGLNFALSVRYVHELLGEMMVKPVAPGFRRCVVCGTKNSAARRSCRKCGADFSAQELIIEPAPIEHRASASASASASATATATAPAPATASESASAPESIKAPDPFLERLEASVRKLEPEAVDVHARGRAVHFTWRDCPLSATIFRDGDAHLSVTAFVREIDADEAASVMRRALEMNLAGALEAKLGLRGAQLYAAAERGLDAIDDVEITALFKRVVDLRARVVD